MWLNHECMKTTCIKIIVLKYNCLFLDLIKTKGSLEFISLLLYHIQNIVFCTDCTRKKIDGKHFVFILNKIRDKHLKN